MLHPSRCSTIMRLEKLRETMALEELRLRALLRRGAPGPVLHLAGWVQPALTESILPEILSKSCQILAKSLLSAHHFSS